MEAVQLDTHIVAWLWQGQPARVKRIARRLKGRNSSISPAVALELQFLHEIGRLRHPAGEIVDGLSGAIGLVVSGTAFAEVVMHSLHLSWCRDPFDRLIVGQAMAAGCSLLTCDQTILANYKKAVDL